MTRRTACLILAALVSGAALGSSVASDAHSTSTFYPIKWSSDRTYGLGYLEPQVNTGDAHSSIHSGAAQWSAVSGAWLDFTFSGNINPMVIWGGSVCSQIGDVWVISRDLSSLGYVGNTTNCGNGTNLTKSMVQFHDGPSGYWYVAAGTPGGSQYDLRSLASHEFGHSMGFSGHFSSTDSTCTQSPIHTMCSGAALGSTYKRSLEVHEKDTFAAAY